ncbi:hypothetical protein LOT_1129 [Lentilactobacillus otakiensis DSM 19908 = JCM 15040]|uniref:Uncharacterized protein n=1 Tax=Lentilactobacillus otakiensis DSM 19908 = JCM 15040 TaxID=1423780 RepID=S4NL14_9LACO|nr:hypothetical protein LOT_1129 [Lentilactobacillus otakiensis DSM 19908 = JCM 15040]
MIDGRIDKGDDAFTVVEVRLGSYYLFENNTYMNLTKAKW